MSDQNQAIGDDIAFLRALAEEGRRGPLVGGSILLASGSLFGTASLVIWAAMESGAASGWNVQLVWPVAGVLFLIQLIWTKSRQPASSGAARAIGQAWSGVGWAMFVIIFSLMLMANRSGDWRLAAAISPVFLALYGAAWIVAALATGARWLLAVGIAAFVMAPVIAWFAVDGGGLSYLLYALSLYGLVGAPGVVLMHQARKAA